MLSISEKYNLILDIYWNFRRACWAKKRELIKTLKLASGDANKKSIIIYWWSYSKFNRAYWRVRATSCNTYWLLYKVLNNILWSVKDSFIFYPFRKFYWIIKYQIKKLTELE